jgi:hypothetical protein
MLKLSAAIYDNTTNKKAVFEIKTVRLYGVLK